MYSILFKHTCTIMLWHGASNHIYEMKKIIVLNSNVQTSNRTSFSRGFNDASKNTPWYRNHPFDWRWIISAGFCGGKYVHKKDFCWLLIRRDIASSFPFDVVWPRAMNMADENLIWHRFVPQIFDSA